MRAALLCVKDTKVHPCSDKQNISELFVVYIIVYVSHRCDFALFYSRVFTDPVVNECFIRTYKVYSYVWGTESVESTTTVRVLVSGVSVGVCVCVCVRVCA